MLKIGAILKFDGSVTGRGGYAPAPDHLILDIKGSAYEREKIVR